MLSIYKKFFDFTGRASKSEYWWFQLYNITIYTLMFVFEGDLVLLFSLLTIANIIPSAAAGVRRIHDINNANNMFYDMLGRKIDNIINLPYGTMYFSRNGKKYLKL